jgi:hypothetical protein
MNPKTDKPPNFSGSITLERDMPAGSKMWIAGWTHALCDAAWVSLVLSDAEGAERRERS